MKFKKTISILLLSLVSLTAFAEDQIKICEGDGPVGHVKLEYTFVEPGQYKALTMTYGDQDVLENQMSIYNNMGRIIFKSSGGIEFNAFESSDDFYVIGPIVGGRMRTTRGQCRDKIRKFRFELSTLTGVPYVFISKYPYMAFIHLYDEKTAEPLICNVDMDVQRFEVVDEKDNLIFSIHPDCRTNLGGVLSASFNLPAPGEYTLKAIPRDPTFEISSQKITVH